MAKKFFVNVFFNVANVDFLHYICYSFDVAYVIFKCCKKNYMLHATSYTVAAGVFPLDEASDASRPDWTSGR